MNTTQRIRFNLVLMTTALLVLIGAASASAQVQTLYQTPGSPSWRDNYTGGSGCKFTVGSSNVVVSHLGFFSTNNVTGLAVSHYVGIYSSSAQLLAQVTVPAGQAADCYTNLFYWMPLDPPFLLSANTTYYVAALPYSGDGDYWGDSFTATFNSFFIGSTAASTRSTAYGPGSSTWPIPSFSTFGSGSTYCVEGMANLPIDQARAGVSTLSVSTGSGQTVSVIGFSSGLPPITNQWWKAGSPNVLLSTTTANYTNLLISNATPASSGTYFMTASNALGGEQSSNVTVLVTAYPVAISRPPTNTTVFGNYLASFSLTATGTPPIYLQWSRNGTAIPGATASNYSLFASFPANNGDIYSCLASNYLAPNAYTAASNATLTVLPNLAYPQEFLHGDTQQSGNTYSGQQGGEFTVGNSPVLITHLAYYALPANRVTNGSSVTCNLPTDHHVGIYNPVGVGIGSYVPTNQLLGFVDIPAGVNPVVNGYMWMPLNPPLVLSNNTTYLLEAETKGDNWGNSYVVPDLNPYFATSCSAIYGGNGWGATPYLGGGYAGQLYSAPNMAIVVYTNPTAYVVPASVAQTAGSSMTLTAFAEGQAPVTIQWYQNGVALPGQTNAALFKPFLQGSDAGNYFVIATNTLTALSATSAVTSVTITTTNQPLTLFVGAHPNLSVSSAAGLGYQWFGNGAPITGATNPVFAPTISGGSPTTFYCVATNGTLSATGAVTTVTILPAPTAPYPAAVLAANPLGYWRLNEPDDGLNDGNPGAICHDYWSGNNGIYTNTLLGEPGYTTNNAIDTDPTETSAYFGDFATPNSDANSIPNMDFSTGFGTNAEFTVEAWVNGGGQPDGDAGIASKGYFNNEEFTLDCGAPSDAYRFEIRSASGLAYNANSTLAASDNLWHHLVGVCDEAHSNIVLYIDGVVAGSATITNGAGIMASDSTVPMIIGSRPTSATSGANNQFFGYINDVAIYNYALSASNVDSQYAVAGVPPNFTQAPPATFTTNDGSTITIPVTIVGTPPMGFQWVDTAQGTNVAIGVTNGPLENATLNVSVPLAWNGDTLQLTVTNAYGTTYASVAFTVNPATPQITQDIQPQDVFIYQPVQFIAAASGTVPLKYQWYFNGSAISGATNSSLVFNSVSAANAGNYQMIVTNNSGSATSSLAALTIEVPATGTYAAAVMGPNLLLYYPLDDAGSGYGIATNQGSLGFAYNGTYEGGYSSVAGPTGSNFGANNQALLLDGYSADVVIPDLSSLTVTNCTIAAWVYDGGGQPDNDAIFFHRQTAVFGLASGNNILGGNDWVKYTWNNGSYDNYTGLVLPTNQWAFVAMVVNPNNATIYLQNGVSMDSISFPAAYPAAPFDGVSYIGWDTAGGPTGRRWNGAIGDVMVFNQALSPTAVNDLYAGTLPPVTLNLAPSGSQLVLTWSQGTLLQATNIAGPWITNNASSPYTITPSGKMLFYRVKVQ